MVGKLLQIRTTCALSFGIVKRVAGYVPIAGTGGKTKARRGWRERCLCGHVWTDRQGWLDHPGGSWGPEGLA